MTKQCSFKVVTSCRHSGDRAPDLTEKMLGRSRTGTRRPRIVLNVLLPIKVVAVPPLSKSVLHIVNGDLLHVVAKYGHDMIDRVRVNQANQLRHDRPACEVLKSSRWLLRNRRNLSNGYP